MRGKSADVRGVMPGRGGRAGGGAGAEGTGVQEMLREREKENENKGISQVEKSILAMGISPVFDPVKKTVVDVKHDFTDMRSFLMK